MISEPTLSLLGSALDQAGDLLGRVDDDRLEEPTPCSDWTVGDLVDHLVQAPVNFATMVRGEEPDWSAGTPPVGSDRATRFRANGDALLGAWRDAADQQGEGQDGEGQDGEGQDGDEQSSPADWQLAELAVHTWDLATALGEPTTELDAEVAERGLAFMQGGLTDDNRSPVFGPEQPAPDGADAYARIAAFAGRSA